MTTYIAFYFAIGFFVGIGAGVYWIITGNCRDTVGIGLYSIIFWPLFIIMLLQQYLIDIIIKKIKEDKDQSLSDYNHK